MISDDYIGIVKMLPDESLECTLRAESSDILGDAIIIVCKDNPDYELIIKGAGGILPGEEKPLKKFR